MWTSSVPGPTYSCALLSIRDVLSRYAYRPEVLPRCRELEAAVHLLGQSSVAESVPLEHAVSEIAHLASGALLGDRHSVIKTVRAMARWLAESHSGDAHVLRGIPVPHFGEVEAPFRDRNRPDAPSGIEGPQGAS